METIKIKVQKTPDFEEVEFALPCYRKHSEVRCGFWKVYSKEKSLYVCVGSIEQNQFDLQPSSCAFKSGIIDCTKEEFEAAYQETLAILNSKL